MWDFHKTSTDNHHWTPGSLGAGYLYARSNTPDSMNLLDYSMRTWNIGPDDTQDIHRTWQREDYSTPILFEFYISPTGGIHDGGKGFKNRTGRPINAVLEVLHRKDNRLYNGHDEIKTNRLSSVKDNHHYNVYTGEPCYCGFGQQGLEKEANLKYKDIKRGEVPEGINPENADDFRNLITRLVEGGTALTADGTEYEVEPVPGIKKLIPWIVSQIQKGNISYVPFPRDKFPGRSRDKLQFTKKGMPAPGNMALPDTRLSELANLFNADQSPFRLEMVECPECEGFGRIPSDVEYEADQECPRCNGERTIPTGNQKVDLNSLEPKDVMKRAERHNEWAKKREEEAQIKELESKQDKVCELDNGWYVSKLNPSAEEAKLEGRIQGNCFQDARQGYQQAVEDGLLDVYVLKSPDGKHQALWAVNTDDGSIAVMEDSSKMYNKPGSDWRGYQVNNPELRDLISLANEKIGINDTYEGHYREGEHFRRFQNNDDNTIYLPPVQTVRGLILQYGEDGGWRLAGDIAEDEGLDFNEDTIVGRGPINWRDVAKDYFTNSSMRGEYREVASFKELIKFIQNNLGQEARKNFINGVTTYLASDEGQDVPNIENLEEFKEWRKLYSEPLAGVFKSPRRFKDDKYYEFVRQQEADNPWAIQMPPLEELREITGDPIDFPHLPASLDPQSLRRKPVMEGDQPLALPEDDRPIEERQRVYEDYNGQMFFAKKTGWDMTPLSAAEELKLHLANIEPKVSHTLSWVKGGRGRGLMRFDGSLITWPVDKKGEPQHADMYEYLTGETLPETHSVQDFILGVPFDIYEDGTLAFFGEVAPEMLVDINKIDYRLKLPEDAIKKSSKSYSGFTFHFNHLTGEPCTCSYGKSWEQKFLRTASQSVRKIKNQDQKHLRSDEGQEILNFLHKLISGYSIEEKGEFGQGRQPGIEGMVPWIVKMLKEEYIKPIRIKDFTDGGGGRGFGQHENPVTGESNNYRTNENYNDNETIVDLGYFNQDGNPYDVKTEQAKIANALPIYTNATDEDQLEQISRRFEKEENLKVTNNPSEAGAAILTIENPEDYQETGDLEKFVTQFTSQSPLGAKAPIVINYPIWEDLNLDQRHAFKKELFDLRSKKYLCNIVDSGLAFGVFYHIAPKIAEILANATSVNRDQINEQEVPMRYYRNIPWNDWSNWFNATGSPARQGKNIMEMTPFDVERAALEHVVYLEDLERIEKYKDLFEEIKDDSTVYEIQDPEFKGWTINKIRNGQEAEIEGAMLRHCIGSDDQPYRYNIEEGNIEAFSLRDPEGLPHAAFHFNPDGTLGHIQGKSGYLDHNDTERKWRKLITEFNDATGRDDNDGEDGHEEQLRRGGLEYFTLPVAETVDDFLAQTYNHWEVAEELAHQAGEELEEGCEIESRTPNWSQIVHDALYNYDEMSVTPSNYNFTDLFNAVHERGDQNELLQGLRDELGGYDIDEEWPDPNYAKDMFKKWTKNFGIDLSSNDPFPDTYNPQTYRNKFKLTYEEYEALKAKHPELEWPERLTDETGFRDVTHWYNDKGEFIGTPDITSGHLLPGMDPRNARPIVEEPKLVEEPEFVEEDPNNSRESKVQGHPSKLHFDPYTGEPCYCQYGARNKNNDMIRVASDAVRKIKNQGQKMFKTEEGMQTLDALNKLISGAGLDDKDQEATGQFPGLEGMVPWIVGQIKKQRIRFFPELVGGFHTGFKSLQGNPESIFYKYSIRQGANIGVIEGIEESPTLKDLNIRGYKAKDISEFSEDEKPEMLIIEMPRDTSEGLRDTRWSLDTFVDYIDKLDPSIPKFVVYAPDVRDGYSDPLSCVSKEMRQQYIDEATKLYNEKVLIEGQGIDPNNLNSYQKLEAEQNINAMAKEKLRPVVTGMMGELERKVQGVSQVPGIVLERRLDEFIPDHFDRAKDRDVVIPEQHYRTISWQPISNWFNARQAPTRKSKSPSEVRGAIGRAIRTLEYRNKLYEDTGRGEPVNPDPSSNNRVFINLVNQQMGIESNDPRRDVFQEKLMEAEEDIINNPDITAEGEELTKMLLDRAVELCLPEYKINIMDLNFEQVENYAGVHQQYLLDLEKRKRLKEYYEEEEDPNVVYHIKDPAYEGWTVVELDDDDGEQLSKESDALGHCIGQDAMYYRQAILEGRIRAFSLRDEENHPKLTWHFNTDGSLAHVQGKSADSYAQWRGLVSEFNNAKELDDNNGGSGNEIEGGEQEPEYLSEWELNPSSTIQHYVEAYDEPYGLAVQELEQHGEENQQLDDECEVYRGGAVWDNIVRDFFQKYTTPEDRTIERFFEIMHEEEEWLDFIQEANAYLIRQEGSTINNETMEQFYVAFRDLHTDPTDGAFEEPKTFTKEEYFEFLEDHADNPWADYLPKWEELYTDFRPAAEQVGEYDARSDYGAYRNVAYLPASLDPDIRERPNVTEEANYTDPRRVCSKCVGTGKNPFNGQICNYCKGSGSRRQMDPVTFGPGEQKVYEIQHGEGPEIEGQTYMAKITSVEKAEAWDKPTYMLSDAQKAHVSGLEVIDPESIWDFN